MAPILYVYIRTNFINMQLNTRNGISEHQGINPIKNLYTGKSIQYASATPEQNNFEDSEEELFLQLGYLPEIYFSLKSDNPAEW
jgi:hypothetical protein